jgi:hypothetical protein
MTDNNFFTKTPLISWFYQLDHIFLPIFGGIIFVLLIFCKNTVYTIPFLLNAIFMISKTEWDVNSVPIQLVLVPVGLIVGFLIYIIRYRVNFFKGRFLIGFSVYALAIIISSVINTEEFGLPFLGIIIYLGFLLFIYGFYTNTITGDYLEYIIKIFSVLGVLIALQVFLYYVRVDDITYALEHKTIDLGWGISNFVATYLIMFICALTYYVTKFKLHIFLIVILLFEVAMLLFTLSRAGIIAFMVTALFILLYMFITYKKRWELLGHLIAGVIIVGAGAYFFRDYFIHIFERLIDRGLDDTGRIVIWKEAIETFKNNPIFGAGFFARSTNPDELRLFHNTILHTLACFGIAGAIGLVIQFVQIIRIFFYQLNSRKSILLIMILGANIHGMVDNTYLMPHYMIIMMVIIAFVENANKIDKIRLELRLN